MKKLILGMMLILLLSTQLIYGQEYYDSPFTGEQMDALLSDGTIPKYDTITEAEAETGYSDNDRCYVVETETFYRYEASGSAYTDDNTFVLSTFNGGDTRWLGITGQYIVDDVDILGNLTIGSISTIEDKLILDTKQSGVVTPYNNILTINADNTKFDIVEMVIAFVDRSDPDPANHTIEIKTFSAETAIPATYLTSNVGTWIGRTVDGTVIQSPTEFTPEQRNTVAQIGRLGHFGKTVITGTFDLPWLSEIEQNWAMDKAAIGTIRYSGAIITANGANLKRDRSIGNFLRVGAGSSRNVINYPQSPAAIQISGIPAWNSFPTNGAILGSATTDIDPLHFDDLSGTLADVTAGWYTNIFEYHFPYKSTVTTFLVYGDKEYSTLDAAIQGVRNEEYNIPSDITGGVAISGTSIEKDTTDLTAAIAGGTATITEVPAKGGGTGAIGPEYWTKTGDDLIPTNPSNNIKLPTGHIELGDAIIEHENVTHDIIYGSGLTGLNDVLPSGTYTETGNALFDLEIDGVGSPNTFRWRIDGGVWTSNVNMTGSTQLLQDGISVTWGSIIDHTNNDYWYLNVGHEVHITEPLHVLDDGTFDGDVTIGGVLKTNSPVRIQEGIEILCDEITDKAKFSTSCTAIDFEIGDVNKVTFAGDGTIEAATSNYETLVTSDNDIPNRKFVMDNTINKNTGWLWGGQITVNAGDNTKIDIATGAAQIVDGTSSPQTTIISWDNQTALIPTPLFDDYTNWVGVQDDGSGNALFVFKLLFDPVDRRTTALLGKIRNNSGQGPTIDAIDTFPRPAWGIGAAFQDFALAFGSFSIAGNAISAATPAQVIADPNNALRLNKTAGESYRYNTQSILGRENHHIDAEQLPRMSYDYHVRGSSILLNSSQIDVVNYDNNGVLTPMSTVNRYARQEVYMWPVSGAMHIFHSDEEYSSLDDAVDAGRRPRTHQTNIDMTNGAIHRASLIVKKNTTNIADAITAGTAMIIPTGGIGGVGSTAGIAEILEDLSPQLGGDLDVNGKAITGEVKVEAKNTAIADVNLANSQQSIYIDETSNTPHIKFKNSTGDVVDRVLDNGLGGSTIIAYWDGRNDPSSAGGGFNQAVMAGNASYDSGNDLVELTPNLQSQNGSLAWQLDQGAGFKAVAEFRISNAAGADAMYFFTHSTSVPTGEESTVGGYVIALDEYTNNIQLRYNGALLTTHEGDVWADNSWHRLEVIINYNIISVAINGVSKIIYQDVNGRDLSGQYLGFGARTGEITNKHDVRRLELYKGNNDAMFVSADGTSVYTSKFLGLGTNDPDRMFHAVGPNANIHVERHSSSGATVFLSNINGSNTTHWKIEVLNSGGGAGKGLLMISDDGIESGGVSTPRFIMDENGHIAFSGTLPTTDAALDIDSTTAAFMPPRMTTGQRDALTASNGMLIYNTTTNQFEGYENGAWVDL